jgi:hypothetical protein
MSVISGYFREYIIIFSFLIMAVESEIILYLLYRRIQLRKSAFFSAQIYLAFALLLIGYLWGFISMLIQNFFYALITEQTGYFYYQSWFFVGMGGVGFSLIIEHLYQKTFKTRYLISISSALMIIVTFLLMNTEFFSLSSIIQLTFVNIFLFVFGGFVWRNSKGTTRLKVGVTMLGFLLIFLERVFETTTLMQLVDISSYYSIGYPVLFGGLLILFSSFLSLPLFNDVDFRENLEELYIIAKSTNETIFYYNFKNASTILSDANQLFPGGILGLQSLIEAMDQNPTPEEIESEVIQQANVELILDVSLSFICVLTIQHRFRIHHEILKQISQFFEQNYSYLFQACESFCVENSFFNGVPEFLHKLLYQ